MRMILPCLALIAGCAAETQRAVYLQPLGDPPPAVMYGHLAPRDSGAGFQPRATMRPETSPPVSAAAARATSTATVPAPPAAVDTEPADSFAATEAADNDGAHCEDFIALRPGTLRLALREALQNRGWTLNHWFAGDADYLHDYPLAETVRIPAPECGLDPLVDWLETHFALRAVFENETRSYDIRGISP